MALQRLRIFGGTLSPIRGSFSRCRIAVDGHKFFLERYGSPNSPIAIRFLHSPIFFHLPTMIHACAYHGIVVL